MNRLQSIAITIAVFVLLIPCLYRIEKEVKNAATQDQVEQLNSKFDALDEVINETLKNPEAWQRVKKIMDR